MAAKSPTQCTLDKWRKLGYTCAVVEKWNPHMKIRQDLFGFIDVIALGDGETIAIQSTSDNGGNLANRVAKINSDDLATAVANVRKAGWKIVAEGWKQKKKGSPYTCRAIDLSDPE